MPRKLLITTILLISLVISFLFYQQYGKKASTFYGDSLGYYLYLPATFIYNNHKDITNYPNKEQLPESVQWYIQQQQTDGLKTPKGYVLNQYTYGIAFLELPFFLIAHSIEKARGLPANGFSETYNTSLKAGTIFYALLGMVFTYLILKRFFSKTISIISITLMFTGSNMFWFTLQQAGMSHIILFFLFAFLMLSTIRIHEYRKTKDYIIIGLTAGMITIIRPTDIICLLIPLLYNVYNKASIKTKVQMLKEDKIKILIACTVFLIPIIPQLFYWKEMTGSYFFYSYGGQSFDWKHPKLFEGLMGFKNGWLAYSPLMLFSMAGFLCFRYYKKWAFCLFILSPLYVYIIYSWYCFNYINGLGSRPMINIYALLSIPFAAFLTFIAKRGVLIKAATISLSILLMAVNISYSVQKSLNILNSEESNMAFNIQTMFRYKLNYLDYVVADAGERQPDIKTISRIGCLAIESFEDSVSEHFVKDPLGRSKYLYHFTDNEHFVHSIKERYNTKRFKGAKWLKCSGLFMVPNTRVYYQHLMVLDISRNNNIMKWRSCKTDNKIGLVDNLCEHTDKIDIYHYDKGRWGHVYFFVAIPDNIKEGDIITLDLWNIGKQELYMDNLTLEIYK